MRSNTTIGSLLHFVNLGSIEQHPWPCYCQTSFQAGLDCAGSGSEEGAVGKRAACAVAVKKVCDEIGLRAFPKTSGSSGIHIYLPLAPRNEYEKVAEFFARLLAGEVASREPAIATVERSIAKRKSNQVYVDWYAERPRPRVSPQFSPCAPSPRPQCPCR